MTFGEYWPRYEEKKKGFVKDTSLAAYRLNWRRHLAPFFGDIEMDDIKNSTIQRYVDYKIAEGLSVHCVQDHIVTLKNMLKLWHLEQDRPISTFTIIWPSKSTYGTKTREKYTDEEIGKLIEYCKRSDSNFCKIVALGAMTGLRIGELCGLQFGDFDFDESTVSVHRTVGRIYIGENKTELYVNPPKCGASERSIPIPPWLNKYFKSYQKLYNIDDAQYISSADSSDKTPFLEPRVFRSRFKSLCSKVGIPYRSFHSLRHSYASRLLQAKVDIRTTAELLGHSDVNTTLNIYAHSDENAKKNAAKKIFL